MSTEPLDLSESSQPEAGLAGPAPEAPPPAPAAALPAVVPILDGAPPLEALPRPYVPKPKPVIIPERTERGCRTAHVEIERAAARAFYITIKPAERPPQRVYLAPGVLDGLLDLVAAPSLEPGQLWRRFCGIPLERPLPNRALEEELRLLLTSFAADLRRS